MGIYPIFIKDLCSACGACWIICPQKAIEPQKEEIGQVFVNRVKNNFWLVTGSAKSGLEETGPVVTQTKKFVLKLAKKIKPDFLLFDTAPGTHCPVISAILDCDLVYCVTEPTPMGAYDLNLILDLCQKLKVPAKVKIEKEIPYSKRLVEAYSKGQLLNFELL